MLCLNRLGCLMIFFGTDGFIYLVINFNIISVVRQKNLFITNYTIHGGVANK